MNSKDRDFMKWKYKALRSTVKYKDNIIPRILTMYK